MTRVYFSLLLLVAPWLAPAVTTHQSLEDIQQAVRSFIAKEAPPASGNAIIEVGYLDPRLRLPACEHPLEAFLPAGARPYGNTTVGVRCNGAGPWLLYVPVTARINQEVIVATRPLSRGAILGLADIRMESRDISSLVSGYITEPAQALGQQLIHPLAPGTPLGPTSIRAPTLVRRGQTVILLVKSGDMEVRMSGQALSDGVEGQTIQIRNMSSRRVVEGTVTADGTVYLSM